MTCPSCSPPYETIPPTRQPDILICAEHAGVEVPSALGGMGIPQSDLLSHIGHDIGVAEVVRRVCAVTGLPAILGRHSRLLVDLNRPIVSGECIVEESDGIPIPANIGLSERDARTRLDRYYVPFHREFGRLLFRFRPRAVLAVHSFTPRLRASGGPRPWHCGILHGASSELGRSCIAHLAAIDGLEVGDNEPYRAGNASEGGLPLHADLKGARAVLLEIRNDLIADSRGQFEWASIVAGLLEGCFGIAPIP